MYGTSFTRVASLRRHFKTIHRWDTHIDCEEPGVFRCPKAGCGKIFMSRRALGKHDICTHNRKSRRCRICSTFLQDSAALKVHLEEEHGVREGEPLPYECDVEGCGKLCRTRKGVLSHKALVHRDRR